MPELGAACGGGGRYDKMVGKFTGQDVPACGFSIGFERIVLLLMESGFTVPMRASESCISHRERLSGRQARRCDRKSAGGAPGWQTGISGSYE